MKIINEDDKRKDWIRTSSGNKFYYWDLNRNEYDIDEIATALANTCRFGGHVKEFYSVAQHSVLASILVAENLAEDETDLIIDTQLTALLHDAAEAYVGDVVRPLKHSRQVAEVFDTIEDDILESIIKKHGGKFPLPANIKEVDNRLLATEMKYLCTHEDCPWYAPYEDYEIYPWTPEQSKEAFLGAYHGLKDGLILEGVMEDA